jgi:hypothetical protein
MGRDRESLLAVIDAPIAFPMIAEAEQTVSGIVALAAVGAGDEAAKVHASAIKVPGNRETCATTARDEEHPDGAAFRRLVFHFFSRSRMRP